MGFGHTAVKTAGEEIGSGGEGTPEPLDQPEVHEHSATNSSTELCARQPRAVLCGSYQRGVPSLVRVYETLTAAGMRVLSPSGLDFIAEIDGVVLNELEAGIPPWTIQKLRLNCIRSADLVWLHAPEGYVGLSGAVEIGFANAAGVRVFAAELPTDIALRPFVTISTLEQVIEQANSTGETERPGAPLPVVQRDYFQRANGTKTAQEIMLLINEEIGELARQTPGQRQQRPRNSNPT